MPACRRLVGALALALGAAGLACSDTPAIKRAHFSGPTGLAVAHGPEPHLFVANPAAGALHVLPLGGPPQGLDALAAPARYFPLGVPVGTWPAAVAASFDGAFVVVVDAYERALRAVDAGALKLLAGADGAPLALTLAADSGEVWGLLASPLPCPAPAAGTCAGRFYVAVVDGGPRLLVVDLVVDGAAYALVERAQVGLNAVPAGLAAHPTAEVVYYTDANGPTLWRLQAPTAPAPSQDAVAIDAQAGAVAAAAGGSVVAVARPSLRDILLLTGDAAQGGPGGPWRRIDANAGSWPPVRCVGDCAAAGPACSQSHPAEQAICSTAAGLATAAAGPYEGAYLGAVPRTLVGLDVPGQSLQLGCRQGGGPADVWPQGIAVATLDGSVLVLGLAPDGQGGFAVRLMETTFCTPPSLVELPGALPLAPLLQACPPQPPGRRALACVGTGTGSGLLVQRGQADGFALTLAWEGVVPGLERSGGGGHLDAEGRLGDHAAGLLAGAGLRPRQTDANGTVTFPGDIVEITSPPQRSAACPAAALAAARAGCMERRLVAVETEADGTWLRLSAPLPAGCYANGQVGYRVRVGDAFLATGQNRGVADAASVRVAPGAAYGLGAPAGGDPRVRLSLVDLPRDPSGDGCATYAADGSVAATAVHSPLLARDRRYGEALADPFQLGRAGQSFNSSTSTVVPAGRLPGGMLLWQPPAAGGAPLLFVSFAGTHSLLAWRPFDVNSLELGASQGVIP